jgi:hypothetical protein
VAFERKVYLPGNIAKPVRLCAKDALYPVQLIRIQCSTSEFKRADLKSADARQARKPALRDSKCASFGP